ncbi:histone-lysine N-methyltransferase SMYD3 [Topomyia yanbarensis]|uniref:histone-lysine N-methyltransferase SMYD3 n=1 Tax=Topomyia yanbarensis TaxID=2498891 RepID=UPI00273AD316|nr:histone-lysine N-methyltransferase SMYD3 [Topomyia yanbarensis]XP_058816454.1 histone-lysine N-methyltransferase SMYD3 [Topomyia yanbarensis]XP_058816455.1 histone-lysine N-methyltransferase SMYD3 [Topomyia yanbarensis]
MKNLFYKRGKLIHTEKPFAYVLQSRYRGIRCDKCFKEGKVLKCSNCMYVRYCNRFCQKEAWQDHQHECIKLKAVAPRTVPDAALMLSRIIRKLQKGGDFVKGFYTSKFYRRFGDLMTHENDIREDEKRMEHFQSLVVVLQSLIDEAAIPSNVELLQIFGKMCINSFNILDDEMNSIGTGMYLGASVMDHSCRPNAVVTFDGINIHVRLLEDYHGAGEMDISKIFISYIDLMDPTDVRRGRLRSQYYFECECDRCRDQQELKLMNAGACPNVDCDEPIANMGDEDVDKCPRCNTAIKSSQRDKFREIITLTKSRLAEMKEIAYLDVCQLCLKKQENILHYYNVWYLKTLDHAFESAINMEKWEEAIAYGLRLVNGFIKYNGPFHPLYGLLLLKIGKIQLFVKQVEQALKNINNSEKVLRITHGEEHDLYKKQLVPLLCQAADEFDMIKK